MKHSYLICAFFIVIVASSSQLIKDLPYDIHRMYTPLSISETQLKDAKTVQDLNAQFSKSWVKEFYSVEVQVVSEGATLTSKSKTDELTSEQIKLLRTADTGSDIKVAVNYTPDNSLKNNSPKIFDFLFSAYPDTEAQYIGGRNSLLKSLHEQAIEKIPPSAITGFALAAVEFTINETGELVEPRVRESSKNEEVDDMLLKAICNLGEWEPARYSDGTATPESYVLTVGSMESCVVNLLNIRKQNF